MIHLCQEKTGIKKEGLRRDSDRQRTAAAQGGGVEGGCVRRIKRTPEITKAFERQVQYRGRRSDYGEGGSDAGGDVRNEGGRSNEMTEKERQR